MVPNPSRTCPNKSHYPRHSTQAPSIYHASRAQYSLTASYQLPLTQTFGSVLLSLWSQPRLTATSSPNTVNLVPCLLLRSPTGCTNPRLPAKATSPRHQASASIVTLEKSSLRLEASCEHRPCFVVAGTKPLRLRYSAQYLSVQPKPANFFRYVELTLAEPCKIVKAALQTPICPPTTIAALSTTSLPLLSNRTSARRIYLLSIIRDFPPGYFGMDRHAETETCTPLRPPLVIYKRSSSITNAPLARDRAARRPLIIKYRKHR
jgi:hypothetical protein